ncbi:MAG: MBL fold metallo-hydrolase [Bacteroidia bacterium]|nr:MBL fold metallo-hydrolase [Bacteroidia bacterium]
MIKIKKFTFNPFQENTFIVWDNSLECAIIDPGCYLPEEKRVIQQFIEENNLEPRLLLNTHAHIDHVMGNSFIKNTYYLEPWMHSADLKTLKAAAPYGVLIGLRMDDPPIPTQFLDDYNKIEFGLSSLDILFTPGHAPGHVSFYHSESNSLFSGDVLFAGGIGRYDLPGGNYQTLMDSIVNKVFSLPNDTTIFCGHGPETTIGKEKQTNPFVLEYLS